MKKLVVGLLAALMLSACGAKETLETVADEIQPVSAEPRQIDVRLPDDAVAPVLESGSEQVYLCEDYELVVETRAGGDLGGTITALTGFDPEELTVIHTRHSGTDRYDFVWVSAGEEGPRLGRAAVLDDGAFHYCLSVLRDGENPRKSQVVWQDVFSSFSLA